MKLVKQISILVLVALGFVIFNVTVYTVCTKPCLPDRSEAMQAKSIELDQYLPFDENSQIVNIKSNCEMKGELPVIDGAAALYPVCSAFVNAVYPQSAVSFDGETFAADSKLQMNNTRGAYKAVVDGSVDIAVCAYPSEEQLQYAADQGVSLELVPIGCEAFVFIVNGDNPVDGLTTEQIRGIYSGDYTNWSQLGGKKLPINPLQRNAGSGSQTAMLSFMGGEKIKKNFTGFLGSAIGFSFRYYVEAVAAHGGVKLLAVDGVYPDKNNIANGSYPIVSNFYAVYDKANDNKNVRPLIQWMLSEDGQRIIEKTGYVPVH
ncbi:substrate-binding domain-containing protein [Anaerovorax odorimutans]|uniref:Substrate-binding domain-containing protein n=1 Tax=Anaerovorax odorimutans TaxID=109327 RepID=A0ABT1RQY9_9FIRM|nr:substrate-binding domain-containing protein [Anaerovorax odorimutans]MCQ4637576.1 substrate-binding domain-containing protein [Anaerovorax odorimutans]